MKNQTACFEEAMFIASESYSNSTYDQRFFQAMDGACEDRLASALDENVTVEISLAA